VLPNVSDVIIFDDDGVCQLCNKINNSVRKDSKNLSDNYIEKKIEEIKRSSKYRKFDCIVGVSGGRDSTYLLYLLTKKHNLRCLAVYYRTPFTPNEIDSNVRRITKELSVDLEEIQLSRKYHKEVAKEIVEIWKTKNNQTLINFACGPCKLVNREVYRIADRHNITNIVYGTNIYEAVQISESVSKTNALIKEGLDFHTPKRKFYRSISLMWSGIKLLVSFPKLIKFIPLGIQSSLMYISPHTSYLASRYPRIKTFDYFYGVEWNECEMEFVLDKLKWKLPKGFHSSWKADCCFAELKNIMFKKTVGITYTDAFFSNLVRAGKISRKTAIERLNTEGKISIARLKEVNKILRMDDSET
jgi:hypothetical protein